MIEIDKLQVVQLLEDEMTRIKQNIAAPVSTDAIEKHLDISRRHEGLRRVQLETEIDTNIVERVENGLPPLCQFVER
jgi:hypothetical protein